ncbi:unnamed protein product [Camellia sinensis]
MKEIKGRGLTRRSEAKAILVEPRNQLRQQKRLCKKYGTKNSSREEIEAMADLKRKNELSEEKE